MICGLKIVEDFTYLMLFPLFFLNSVCFKLKFETFKNTKRLDNFLTDLKVFRYDILLCKSFLVPVLSRKLFFSMLLVSSD